MSARRRAQVDRRVEIQCIPSPGRCKPQNARRHPQGQISLQDERGTRPRPLGTQILDRVTQARLNDDHRLRLPSIPRPRVRETKKRGKGPPPRSSLAAIRQANSSPRRASTDQTMLAPRQVPHRERRAQSAGDFAPRSRNFPFDLVQRWGLVHSSAALVAKASLRDPWRLQERRELDYFTAGAPAPTDASRVFRAEFK